MTTPSYPSTDVRPFVLTSIFAFLVLVFGFGLWAATAQISGAVIASGQVEMEVGNQVVQHPDGGVVDEILVADGEFVPQGKLLIQLQTGTIRTHLAYEEERLFYLYAVRDRLLAEADHENKITFAPHLVVEARTNKEKWEILELQRRIFTGRIAQLEAHIAKVHQSQQQLTFRISGLKAKMEAVSVQNIIAGEELDVKQALSSKGLIYGPELRRLKQRKSEIQGEKGKTSAELAAAEAELLETDNDIAVLLGTFHARAIEELSSVYESIQKVRQSVLDLENEISGSEIRAPSGGIIYQLSVNTRNSVVRPAEPLLYIIPQDKPRIVMARISPADVSHVLIGQQVKLRLLALDSRTTPEISGKIVTISADAIEAKESGQNYFAVKISVSGKELDRLPEGSAIRPGMPVDALILTNARTPLAYLVRPITDYLAYAMREN